jgi:cytosine/adenosine deaminase-related metal-dependent hydrolase
MITLLKNASLLYGKDLDYIGSADIIVRDGLFDSIIIGGSNDYDSSVFDSIVDCEGLLIMPSFINAHTHIADSIAKDIASEGLSFNESIHPVFGVKRRVLNNTREEHLMHFIKASALTMIKNGITTFIDFREQGLHGVRLLKASLNGISIRCIALGRVEYYNKDLSDEELREAEDVIEYADGLGLSGANEYSDDALKHLAYIAKARGKLFGLHACESQESYSYSLSKYGVSEVKRILSIARPDFLVHMTNATDDDLMHVKENGIGIVVCPRANASLGVGIPRIWDMLRLGCTIAIGTDNIMLNKPDMFREMEYIWKVSRALKQGVNAKDILKMATVNAAMIFRLSKIGYIDAGMRADAIIIDKYHVDIAYMHNPYVALVQRASESSIKGVMMDGNIIYGNIG